MTERAFPLDGKRIFVADHRGMVGSAIVRALRKRDCAILTAPRSALDLRRQQDVEGWMQAEKPDAVFLAAARVGGILANDTRPAEFICDNLAIETAVIEGARRAGVRKLQFLGSSCIYPRMAPQPMAEDALLTGPLEPTNEWYAIAKIAGIRMCQAYRRQYGCDYISLMPTNLYGPGDNFDLRASHVVPALMRKMHEAKATGADTVTVLGPGRDVTIAELVETIREIVGFRGRLAWDRSKPDGTPRKLQDVTRLTGLGWRATTALPAGLANT